MRLSSQEDVPLESTSQGHEGGFCRVAGDKEREVRKASDDTGVVLELDDVVVVAVLLRVLHHSDQRLSHRFAVNRDVSLTDGDRQERDRLAEKPSGEGESSSYPKEPVPRVL